jgi:pSer/pThr/pTyr-binding forkhead associated (FHA) protein
MAKKVTVSVYAGNLLFREYGFEQDVITIGRRPDNDIYLNHASVSLSHARIDLRAMTVTDLESTNGTFVAGERITMAKLQYDKPIYIEPYSITVSDRIIKRSVRHSDTLVLTQAELAEQITTPAKSESEANSAAESPIRTPGPSSISGWVEEMPQWFLVVLLAAVIALTFLLIFVLLSS